MKIIGLQRLQCSNNEKALREKTTSLTFIQLLSRNSHRLGKIAAVKKPKALNLDIGLSSGTRRAIQLSFHVKRCCFC